MILFSFFCNSRFLNVQEKSFNALGVSAVYVEQDMFDHPPNAERAVQIEQLTQENFLERIGMGRSDEESRSLGLDSALWVASSLLPGSANVTNKYIKQHRVLLLTRDDCPASDSAIVQQRARNISVKGATLQLAPLAGPDDEFDYTRFWESVLLAAPPSTPFYVATPSDRQDEGITDLAKSVDNDVREQILSMPALASVVRMRAYRKRSTSRMSWALGPGGPVIGIRLYALVQPAWPAMRGPPSWLHAADYCKLELDRQPIDTTTGIPLDKSSGMHQPRLYYPKTADRWAAKHNETEQNKNHPGRRRFPKVYFEPDEVAALKWPVTKGMSLLAFKPMTTLLPWHQLRPPSFCFPDEHAMPGSFRAFSCLHAAMLERHVYAVCAFVRSPSSEPRLVAAVPQSEERDEGGAQVTPPGFHLIHLPYSDDVRYPESDITFTGPLQSKSFDDVSEQATDKLLDRLEQISDSVPDLIDIPNPHVQRWFQVLEGVLMREAGVIGTISHLTNQDDPVNTVDNMTFQGIEDVVDGFLVRAVSFTGSYDSLFSFVILLNSVC